jgi:acyl carrier protein
MSSILKVDIDEINMQTSMDNISNWDSLKQMNLIIALEREFDIELSDDEINELTSVEIILETLEEKDDK